MKRLLLAVAVAAWLFTLLCSFVVGMNVGHEWHAEKLELCMAEVKKIQTQRDRLAFVAQRQDCALIRAEPILTALVPEWRGWWPQGRTAPKDCPP